MALVKCSECGKEISDKAVMCPHCGYKKPEPFSVSDTWIGARKEQEMPYEKKMKMRIVLVVCAIGLPFVIHSFWQIMKAEKAQPQKIDVMTAYLNNPNVTLVTVKGHIIVCKTSNIPTNRYELLEQTVTVLAKHDEINILERGLLSTKILVLTHNGKAVFWKGWIPSDFIDNEDFKVKIEI